MKKCEKTHILGIPEMFLPVQLEFLPVQLRFWSFLAKFYLYNLGFYRYNCYSVPSLDQFSYFDHNLLIYYPI